MNIDQACFEILEEIARTIENANLTRTAELIQAIQKAKRIFVTGAGRSGLMMQAFAMRLMQVGVDTFVVGETTTPSIEKDDLLIIGSGSGSTGGPMNYAQIAKHVGVRVALVTAAMTSPLNEMADIVVRLPAPTPKIHEGQPLPRSVQPLGSLFEQTLLVYLDALIIMLMKEMDVAAETLLKRHVRLE